MARRRRPDQSRNNTSETSESNGMTSFNELNKSAPSSNGKIETVKALSEDSNGVEEETRDKTETLHTIKQEIKETTKQEELNEKKESNGITSNACGIFKQKKEMNGSNNNDNTDDTTDSINNNKDNDDNSDNDSKEEEYEVEMKHVCTPEDKVAALNAFALYSTERLKEIENDVIHSNERCKSKNDNADERQSNSLNREESQKKDDAEVLSKSNDVKQINVGENHNVVNEGSINNKNNHSNVDNTSDDSLRPSLSTSEDRQTPNNKASHKIKRVHIITPAIELLPADLDNNQHPRETRCLESSCAKCVIM